MSYTSEVDICNSALVKIGQDRISSLSENNPRARVLNERYSKVRDRLLRSYQWNFATSYVELALIDPKPADIYEYSHVFQLPSDCLRVLDVSLDKGHQWEEIEGRRIACHASELTIKFIKKITDVTKYDPNFCETLAYELAEDVCFTITQSAQQVENLRAAKKEYLRDSRTFDSQVGSVRQVSAEKWIASRRY